MHRYYFAIWLGYHADINILRFVFDCSAILMVCLVESVCSLLAVVLCSMALFGKVYAELRLGPPI